MDENGKDRDGRPPLQVPEAESPGNAGGAAPGSENRKEEPAAASATPRNGEAKPLPAAVENQVPGGESQAGGSAANPSVPEMKKAKPETQAAGIGAESGGVGSPRGIGPRKDASTAREPLTPATAPRGQRPETAKLGRLEDEMSRLHGFLEARNFAAADRLSEAVMRSGVESRAFPMLGKVKFLLNQFAAAETLWAKALEANFMVSLEVVHSHGGADDFCLGQLKFKKKIILFSSNTRGDHSFALVAGGIRSFAMSDGMWITIKGVVDGQEISENFQVAGRGRRLEKGKFLVAFLNQYVL
jgi:hypothetical protein